MITLDLFVPSRDHALLSLLTGMAMLLVLAARPLRVSFPAALTVALLTFAGSGLSIGYQLAPALPDGTPSHVVGVNVGGAIVPTVVAIWLGRRVASLRMGMALVVVTLAVHWKATFDPTSGVLLGSIGVWALAALAGAAGTAACPQNAGRAGYALGALGVLVGADLMNLPDLWAFPEKYIIGGRGAADAIACAAAVAATVGCVCQFVLHRVAPHRVSAPNTTSPIATE